MIKVTKEQYYLQKALIELRKGGYSIVKIGYTEEGDAYLVYPWGHIRYIRSITYNSISTSVSELQSIYTGEIKDPDKSRWSEDKEKIIKYYLENYIDKINEEHYKYRYEIEVEKEVSEYV